MSTFIGLHKMMKACVQDKLNEEDGSAYRLSQNSKLSRQKITRFLSGDTESWKLTDADTFLKSVGMTIDDLVKNYGSDQE